MAKPTRETPNQAEGASFKRHRQALRLSANGLAEAFGLKGWQYIQKIEQGKRAPMAWMWTLLRIWTDPDCPAKFKPKPTPWLVSKELNRIKAQEAQAQKQESPGS